MASARIAKVFTIGVYGTTRAAFFDTLEDAGIDVLIDVRRRRAVRGSIYSFANALRLTTELQERGIHYRHVLDLAPHPETLALQGAADERDKRLKSERTQLDPQYVAQYTARTLSCFDFAELARELGPFHAPVVFCIERIPAACHRSLVAPELAKAVGAREVVHLIPPGEAFDAQRALQAVRRKRAARRKRFG